MSKFFKRLGTSKLRYQFDLLLQEARLDVPVVGPIMLVLRRGGKRIETKGTASIEDGVLRVNERMSMLATMYRDKKGKFQEKTVGACSLTRQATIQVLAQVPVPNKPHCAVSKLVAVTKIDLSRYAIPPTRQRSGSTTSRGESARDQPAEPSGGSTQCVHQICLKLLKSSDPDARLSMEVRSLYLEEAISEIASSIGSDYASMGELSSCGGESDRGESCSGFKICTEALRKKAKKLSLQNQLEVSSKQCTPQMQMQMQMQVKRVDLHKKIKSTDAANTPRPFQDLGNRPKSPFDISDFEENQPAQKTAEPPRVASYSVTRDSSCSTISEPQTAPQPRREGGGRGAAGAGAGAGGGSYLSSYQLKQQRQEDFRCMLSRLKEKKQAPPFVAPQRKAGLARIQIPQRFRNYSSFSGSVTSETTSASPDIATPTPPEKNGSSASVKGAITLDTELGGAGDCERENDALRMQMCQMQKENARLRRENETLGQQLRLAGEQKANAEEKKKAAESKTEEQGSQLKRLREKLEVQQNVLRELRAKNETLLAAGRQEEGWSRQGCRKELDALKEKLRQREVEAQKARERERALSGKLEESEGRVGVLQKETAECKLKFDELLFNYGQVEEQLIEERALLRETRIAQEQLSGTKLRFANGQVRAKLLEMRNLKRTISEALGLQAGELQEYQKEIARQLGQLRIEHRLQRERQGQVERFSEEVQAELLEAKRAVGRYEDDVERYQKHIEKLSREGEEGRAYASKLEVDVFRCRQELAESVNVIGEQEKENLELRGRLEACLARL